MLPRPGWERDAACRGADPRLFDCHDAGGTMTAMTATARTYCRTCPVIGDCALTADRYRYRGLWAGSYRGVANRPYRRVPLIGTAPMHPLPDKDYLPRP